MLIAIFPNYIAKLLCITPCISKFQLINKYDCRTLIIFLKSYVTEKQTLLETCCQYVDLKNWQLQQSTCLLKHPPPLISNDKYVCMKCMNECILYLCLHIKRCV